MHTFKNSLIENSCITKNILKNQSEITNQIDNLNLNKVEVAEAINKNNVALKTIVTNSQKLVGVTELLSTEIKNSKIQISTLQSATKVLNSQSASNQHIKNTFDNLKNFDWNSR